MSSQTSADATKRRSSSDANSVKSPSPKASTSATTSSTRANPKREWTERETELLLERVQTLGEQWEVIASLFTPRRTVLDCTQRYSECTKNKTKRTMSILAQKDASGIEFNPPVRRVRKAYLELDRPFRCTEPSCDKAYGTEGALRTHKKLKHQPKTTPATTSSPLPELVASPSPVASVHSSSPSPTSPTTISTSHNLNISDDSTPSPTPASYERPTTNTSTPNKYNKSLSGSHNTPTTQKSKQDIPTFEIDALYAGTEIQVSEGYYTILLALLAGAIHLEIESQVEVIRLVMPLSGVKTVARSLDECLFKPVPYQLQFILDKTPDVYFKELHGSAKEWKKLALTDIPNSSMLDSVVRSSVYELSMKFTPYASLLEEFAADPAMRPRLVLSPPNQLSSQLLPVQPQLPASSLLPALLQVPGLQPLGNVQALQQQQHQLSSQLQSRQLLNSLLQNSVQSLNPNYLPPKQFPF